MGHVGMCRSHHNNNQHGSDLSGISTTKNQSVVGWWEAEDSNMFHFCSLKIRWNEELFFCLYFFNFTRGWRNYIGLVTGKEPKIWSTWINEDHYRNWKDNWRRWKLGFQENFLRPFFKAIGKNWKGRNYYPVGAAYDWCGKSWKNDWSENDH